MKRGLSIVAAWVLLLSAIGWLAYVPPSAQDIYAPIPVDASYVRVDGETDWLTALRNPLAELGFQAVKLQADKEPLYRWILGQELAVAMVPVGGRDRSDAMVLVSRLGFRALPLRWHCTLMPPDGVSRIRSYAGRPVWELERQQHLYTRFTLSEGLLIAVFSEDSHDIYRMIDTLDGRYPSYNRRKNR